MGFTPPPLHVYPEIHSGAGDVRYRLRFHLQEVDLSGDEVIVGRGATCQITIDDPMLSRRHARLDLRAAEPEIEDLGSRNGTQLNGRPLRGRAALRDGDRIRLGTQELVFLAPRSAPRDFRTTSGLRFCVGCAVPYPSTSVQCPHCGVAFSQEGEAAMARDVAASGWTFPLLAEVVARAIEQGRLADAERMLSRGIDELEDQLARGVDVDPVRISAVAECSARLGAALRTARWLDKSALLYGRAACAPPQGVLELLDRVPVDPLLGAAVERLRHLDTRARQAR